MSTPGTSFLALYMEPSMETGFPMAQAEGLLSLDRRSCLCGIKNTVCLTAPDSLGRRLLASFCTALFTTAGGRKPGRGRGSGREEVQEVEELAAQAEESVGSS